MKMAKLTLTIAIVKGMMTTQTKGSPEWEHLRKERDKLQDEINVKLARQAAKVGERIPIEEKDRPWTAIVKCPDGSIIMQHVDATEAESAGDIAKFHLYYEKVSHGEITDYQVIAVISGYHADMRKEKV